MRAPAVALLVALIAAPALAQTPQPVAKPVAPGRVVVSVEDLHCKTCAKKVARKLYGLKGVNKVTTSLKNDLVVAHHSPRRPLAPLDVWRTVEAGGMKPVELRYADQRLGAEQIEALAARADAAPATR